jgi:hypothetical protein
MDVGIDSASASEFGLKASETVSWAPYLLSDRLSTKRYSDFLATVLPRLLDVVPEAMRQRL